MLTTTGLTRIFANRYDSIAGGVRDASFTLAAGDFFTLLGPSGCGKTTTLRCLAGLERPDAGRIDLAGQTIFDAEAGTLVPVHRRGIGMVFQSYAIWPHMTVFENVAFPLRVAQTRTPREDLAARVERALATVGLAGYGPRPSSTSPSSSCSTNPSPTSTPPCARKCAANSAASNRKSASPPSTSPTTRPKPSPCRT